MPFSCARLTWRQFAELCSIGIVMLVGLIWVAGHLCCASEPLDDEEQGQDLSTASVKEPDCCERCLDKVCPSNCNCGACNCAGC